MILRLQTSYKQQLQYSSSSSSTTKASKWGMLKPSRQSTTKRKVIYCDFKTWNKQQQPAKMRSCDQNLISCNRRAPFGSGARPLVIAHIILLLLLASLLLLATPLITGSASAYLQQANVHQAADSSYHHARPPPTSGSQGHAQAAHTLSSPHLQPSFVYGLPAGSSSSRNNSSGANAKTTNPPAQQPIFNFTHIAYDDLTNSIYVGGTNWLFQLSGTNLRPEHALKVGPTRSQQSCSSSSGSGSGSGSDQCQEPIVQHDLGSLPLRHATGGSDYFGAASRMRTNNNPQATITTKSQLITNNQLVAAAAASAKSAANQTTSQLLFGSQQTNAAAHNYNKILAIDPDSRQLIVCWSLNQGACRKHSLGQLSNYSDLIPMPVVSNDETSSSVAFIPKHNNGAAAAAAAVNQQQQQQQQQRLMYVAATNSRPDPYRDMVPAISARYLEPAQKSMQIIESSFAEARVDISFELRDYYLVNYVYAFQHGEFVYFATVQRRSPLRQLEEWGYITRLARLCLNDLSFQSYTEMTLECSSSSPSSSSSSSSSSWNSASNNKQHINYNLLQDAQLISAGSDLVQQLRLTKSNQVLATVFAQSRDHSTRTNQPGGSTKSAVCLFPMEMIEQRFNENIQQCYNGTVKSRNMNYIGGSVSDCPRPGSASLTNVCSEPLKLNGSLPLTSSPLLTYEDELLTAIAGLQAPTSPLSLGSAPVTQSPSSSASSSHDKLMLKSQRSHQVLVLGTGSGLLKRVLVQQTGGGQLAASEFDSIQLQNQEQPAEPVLADLHVTFGGDAIAGTAKRIVKLKVNGCKYPRSSAVASRQNASNLNSLASDCDQCHQLQDPFCGWCSSSNTCSTRDECIQASSGQLKVGGGIQWSPFDQIKCNDYKPIEPRFVPLQSDNRLAAATVDVNVRLAGQQQLQLQQAGSQLAQAQFVCHFDYLKHANRSMTSPLPRISGATTKATQARLNPHTSTVSIACPLPSPAQRPLLSTSAIDQTRVRLSVRLSSSSAGSSPDSSAAVEQLLGLSSTTSGKRGDDPDQSIQRELTMYDCSVHTNCRTCLNAGSNHLFSSSSVLSPSDELTSSTNRRAAWSCAWCPLSNRCTFNPAHSEFGCAASAIAGPASLSNFYTAITTPQSVNNGVNNLVRASHLAMSLDQAQANVFGIFIERLAQCPVEHPTSQAGVSSSTQSSSSMVTDLSSPANKEMEPAEILIASGSRRSIQVQLDNTRMSALLAVTQQRQRTFQSRFECLIEIEGMKARLSARFVEPNTFVCQENQFVYQEEVATLRGQLYIIQPQQNNLDGQAIDSFDVILYKCHLFGINPPALISTVGSTSQPGNHHSSVTWRAHELLQSIGGGSGGLSKRSANSGGQADCSLCLNIERKYQCAWCQNQCRHSDQCSSADLQAGSTCPPPRIDSIHPTSGPLEGGTLLTIEGSNLGSNEREIQDKITVGGEPCQLVMYSVSTRIVCKTSASLQGPQAATVFVGNRAGITSAYEKFHYKAVHLTDVNPRFGPVSGGTRLYLSGSNLNIGSRVQIFLDEIPCSIQDPLPAQASNTNENPHQHQQQQHSSINQISCITAPNLLASSMRITKLTLMIDNSTHQFPYPFTYQPDPIITSIEPAESFLSGGRLILVMGHHLASPQSTKLMVYHESKHSIVNATSCITQNDTLITCLTPAISRDLLAAATDSPSASYNPSQQDSHQLNQVLNEQGASHGMVDGYSDVNSEPDDDYRSILSYQMGGLKLKMSLIMDDVKSVRNLDEYYHHLPHYLTYYENPQLFRLQPGVVDFQEGQDLIIRGENLQMKQLDQDMLITIGSHQNVCLIKTITANQMSCEPPKRIAPVRDEHGQIVDRPVLPIIALIGSNLRYNIGFMRYNSKLHYQQLDQQQLLLGTISPGFYPSQFSSSNTNDLYQQQPTVLASGLTSTPSSLAILVTLSVIGFIVGLGATMMFALSKFRQSKAEREYKRIQLQIGLLDINGQPTLNSGGGLIFDKRLNYGNATATPMFHQQQQQSSSAHRRALNYIGSLSSKKLLNQLTNNNHHRHHQQAPSFPSSPLTDVSSLAGGNLLNSFNNQFIHQQQHQQQHVIKLANNGTISTSTYSGGNHIYSSANPSSLSSQSSPGSTRDQQQQPLVGQHHLQQQQHLQQFIDGQHTFAGNNNNSLVTVRDQQNGFQSQLMKSNDKSQGFLLTNNAITGTCGNSRNFNWTQDAPSTIVPYAVIEACNLTLDGKNQPTKEFV